MVSLQQKNLEDVAKCMFVLRFVEDSFQCMVIIITHVPSLFNFIIVA